jgi:hypothetical protein
MKHLAAVVLAAIGITPTHHHLESTPSCTLNWLYNSYGKPVGGRSRCSGDFFKQYVVVGCGNGGATLLTVTGPLADSGETSTKYCPWYLPRANWISRKIYL